MDYNKPFNFLKNLPTKLNSFYKIKSRGGIVVNNKSKSNINILSLSFISSHNLFVINIL